MSDWDNDGDMEAEMKEREMEMEQAMKEAYDPYNDVELWEEAEDEDNDDIKHMATKTYTSKDLKGVFKEENPAVSVLKQHDQVTREQLTVIIGSWTIDEPKVAIRRIKGGNH